MTSWLEGGLIRLGRRASPAFRTDAYDPTETEENIG